MTNEELTNREKARNLNPNFAILASEGKNYLGGGLSDFSYIQSEINTIESEIELLSKSRITKASNSYKNMLKDLKVLSERKVN